MATPYKLVRNSRAFFTTAVNATTGVIGSAFATDDTFEFQILDGFSFSQGTQQSTVQISEAGTAPARGQRAFNTAVDPVEFSFSTYVRPYNNAGTITAEESYLWNALFSDKAIDSTDNAVSVTSTAFSRASTATNVVTFTCASTDFSAKGIASGDVVSLAGVAGNYADQWNSPAVITLSPSNTAATSGTITYLRNPSAAAGTAPATANPTVTYAKYAWTTHAATGTGGGAVPAHAQVHTGQSNKNQLQKFGIVFIVDDIVYCIDNCVMDQVSLDFSLDGIATLAWSGKGIALRNVTAAATAGGVWSGSITGNSALINSNAAFITNKLSTMKLVSKITGSDGSAGTSYNIAITGGNLTISNNVSYVVPANLGVVNQAIGYFTGSRSISGNVTAYLKTGTAYSAQLLSDIIAANAAETKFKVQIEVGGANNTVHVDFLMNGAMLQIPTIETGDVMSTTINFTAQGYDALAGTAAANQTYDLSQTNELYIKYHA